MSKYLDQVFSKILSENKDIERKHIQAVIASPDARKQFFQAVKNNSVSTAAEIVREHIVRLTIKTRLDEIVRKKHGGGYTVYKPKDPNKPNSDEPAQKAGEVGNLATAYDKLASITKDLKSKEKLQKRAFALRNKNKKKHKDTPKKGAPDKIDKINISKPAPATKKESVEKLRFVIGKLLINERLFREEQEGSNWDQFIAKHAGKSLKSDKKFQSLQSKIDDVSEKVLENAFVSVKKLVGKTAKLDSKGVKKNEQMGKTYLIFSAEIDKTKVDPIYIYIDKGMLHMEIPQEAIEALSSADPNSVDLFRGKLSSVQEKILDKERTLIDAISARDKYLDKIKDSLDDYVGKLTPVEQSILKVSLMSVGKDVK